MPENKLLPAYSAWNMLLIFAYGKWKINLRFSFYFRFDEPTKSSESTIEIGPLLSDSELKSDSEKN